RCSEAAARDRPAPKRGARRPAARQRPLTDGENFGGEVSFLTSPTSLDHLVGEREQIWRDFDAPCLCGGGVDEPNEFCPEFDWQVAGLFALEDAADVDTGAAISIRLTWSVAHQAANLSVLA